MLHSLPDTIDRLCSLARIPLTAQEKQDMPKHLQNIINFLDSVHAIDNTANTYDHKKPDLTLQTNSSTEQFQDTELLLQNVKHTIS
ncbi:hypothetical protein GW750_00710 [bacterium]|nr:hypothetical protein [bacterium]